MKLRWTARARDDLVGIARFVANDNVSAARRWVNRLRKQARRAAQFPRSGRIVPEFGRPDIRELIVRNYRIVYRVLENEIHILTVFEAHRLLKPEVEETRD